MSALKPILAAACRIDDDHYGAGFHYRFGTWDDDPVKPVAASYAERSEGRNPKDHLAVGDARDIIQRIQEYVDAGISKFILRPIGANDEDLISQTRFLAEEVIPEVEGWKAP